MMNSLYGATANIYFLYYISDMAEAITTSGQLSDMKAEKVVNKYLNRVMETEDADYVTYCDTDSVYVNMAPLIERFFGTLDITREQGEKFIDTVCKTKIEPEIAKGYEALASQMGAFRNAMHMSREKISDRSIFIAKKRYIMSVLNSEGVHYSEPKIAVTGVEAVRSSTPDICRRKMEEAFKVFLNGSEKEAQEFIQTFKEEFKSLKPEDVAKISGTDDIEKFMDSSTLYTKRCPIHVRGAILYNKALKDRNLLHKYELIQSGDKVKFIYLKTPNTIKENVISFLSHIPKEFELDKYIDYETQFNKVFLKPLEIILNTMGWSPEKVDTLEDFFM